MTMTTAPIEAKRKPSTIPKVRKTCAICGQKRNITEFYTNPKWDEEKGVDKWCKDCVQKLTNKGDFRRYMWENRRKWNDDLWKQMMVVAERKLLNNPVYIKQTDERKRTMLERVAIQNCAGVLDRFYEFIEVPEGRIHKPFMDAVMAGEVDIDDDDPGMKHYSEFFNGNFTNQELDYLTKYYNKLEEDFHLDNENLRDYAKKCARASLQADKAQDDYAQGRCSFADVKDALTQFDMLSKSANFAACKRKAGDTSGLTCWAETTLYLETHGYCKETAVEWPQDDVDRVIASLSHTVKALGLDSI